MMTCCGGRVGRALICVAAAWTATTDSHAEESPPSQARVVLPVPGTLSPQMQAIVARPPDPHRDVVPKRARSGRRWWPVILTSGTRDLYLSHTVRVHRRLRAAGVEAVLQVWEGLSHAKWNLVPDAPETRECHDEVARFLDRHLGP